MDKKSFLPMLVVLYIGAFAAGFTQNIMNVALPDIMAEFSISSITAQWLVTGFMIISCNVVAICAYLQRRFKLKSLFAVGSVALVIGSVVGYFAPNYPVLLLGRLLQSPGVGMFITLMMSTVMQVVPHEKAATYISIGSCCITIGPATSPVISGIMVTYFGWRAVFIPSAIIALVLTILSIWFLKNFAETEACRLDILSLVLSILGLVLLTFGLTRIMSHPLMAAACIVVAVLILAVFTRRQGRIGSPLLNMKPMKDHFFLMACILAILIMMTSFSMSVLLPLYFQSAAGTTALLAGLLMLIPVAINAITAVVGGWSMDKFGEWPGLPIGLFVTAAGVLFIALVAKSCVLVYVVMAAALIFCGLGFTFSPTQASGLKLLALDQKADGSAIINVFIQIAGCVGPSLYMGILDSVTSKGIIAGLSQSAAFAGGFTTASIVATCVATVAFVLGILYARGRKRAEAALSEEAVEAAE